MGALLVAGILPSGRCEKIPEDGGASLRNPAVPVGYRELQDARRVLKDWLDWDLDRRDGDEESEPTSAVAPMEFLLWCDEEYEGQSEWKKPGWLDYLRSFIRIQGPTDAPLPAPPKLVARAAELESVASFMRFDDPRPKPAPSLVKSEDEIYVAQMTAAIRRGTRLPIGALIIKALAASDDPMNLGSVWAQLCQMAQSGKHLALQWDSVDDSIKVIRAKSQPAVYTRDTLQKFLQRYRDKVRLLPESEPTSSPGEGSVAG